MRKATWLIWLAGLLLSQAAWAEQRGQNAQNWQSAWWLASQGPQQSKLTWHTGAANQLSGSDQNLAQMPDKTPLGSLWKLFVFAYMVDTNIADKPYACHTGAQAVAGDEYCCTQDESINRNNALARSCGAYFKPARLGITPQDWAQYWQKQAPNVNWLHNLSEMRPETTLSVQALFDGMRALSPSSVAQSRQVLLARLLQPKWSPMLVHLGGAYRFKTYTWRHPQFKGAYFGGAAGWLADGRLFWLGGAGTSYDVLQRAAPTLSRKLAPARTSNLPDECVMVRYFKRYPIAQVLALADARKPQIGSALNGSYAVKFSNGQSLNIKSQGELYLQAKQKNPVIYGRLDLQEYVARVIDREADASITAAATALSVAARSYLYQNARFHQGCWQIDDDSRTQRVSPVPATAKAFDVAQFTQGLSLTGQAIYYHADKPSPHLLSWKTAVTQAKAGEHYVQILNQAYPQASWRLPNQGAQCPPMADAANYLNTSLAQSRASINALQGYEPVPHLKICQLDYGNPYADAQNQRIYIRDWRSENDRISLWHEYLHLALAHHPNGSDEAFIEHTAQQLARNSPHRKHSHAAQ